MCHRGIPNPSERVKLCVAGWMSLPLLTRLARATWELRKGFRDVGVLYMSKTDGGSISKSRRIRYHSQSEK